VEPRRRQSRGLFSLQVALELAKTNNDAANSKNAVTTLYTLGVSYFGLAERSPKEGFLKAAQDSFQTAVRRTNRAMEPLFWSSCQSMLGCVLREIGQRNYDAGTLRKSESALRGALEVGEKHDSPDLKRFMTNLGVTLTFLGEFTTDPVLLKEAVTCLTNAISRKDKTADPIDWALSQNNLGLALHRLGAITEDLETLDRAREAYDECMALDLREEAPMQWARNQWNIADLALARSELDPDPALLVEAREYVTRARDFFVEGSEFQTQRCDELIARIDALEVEA